MENGGDHSSWGWKDYLSFGANLTKKKLSRGNNSPGNNGTGSDGMQHFNPESLTDKERVSRIVFAQKKKSIAKGPYTGPIYDQFLVVGLKNANDKQPEILFKHPEEASNFPGIVGLCFPEAVEKRHLKRSASNTNLYELICSHTQFTHSSNSFIFMLTTEIAEVFYGICVRTEESLEHNPPFVLEKKGDSIAAMTEHKDSSRVDQPDRFSYPVGQKCIILISRYPFFQLHFEVLYGILAMEHVFVMSHVQLNSILEQQKSNSASAKIVTPSAVAIIASQDGSDQEFIAKFNNLDLTVADASSSAADIRSKGKEAIAKAISDLLKRYRAVSVPNPGQTLEFPVPFSPKPLSFTRPSSNEEEEAMCDYGLPIALYLLTLRHFFTIFSAALLEKKILIVCSNLRILSAVVLSFTTLFRPFSWQSILIPILPTNLTSLLDAPLPFILGAPRIPSSLPEDVIIVELDSGTSVLTLGDNQILPLPRRKEFEPEFTKIEYELRKTFTKGQIPYETTSKQLRLSKQILSCCEKYLSSLFSQFPYFCIRDLTESSTPITIFIKDAFLNHASVKVDYAWFKTFLDTQMFFNFQDERLQKADALARKNANDLKDMKDLKAKS